MTKYAQKPDNALATIRAALDEVGCNYIVTPPGLGCDIIAFRHGVKFLEVKNQGERVRLTRLEARLQELAGEHFAIVRTPEEALIECGYGVM